MLNIAIWRGELRPPSIPQRPALGRSSQAGLAALSLLPARPDGRSPHRRRLRVSPAELDDLGGQGRGRRPCRCLPLRQAMARARTWTAPAAAVERERTRQVAGIGCNLNQTARWANTHGSAAEAVAP